MGEVYKARDVRLDRFVAIKVLPADVAAEPGRLRRFEQEARAASALNHPNILTVLDVGSENSISFIATELVVGKTLRELILQHPLPVRLVLDVAIQIAEGLSSAHEAGIVHRDMKPSNVMWTDDRLVKIVDFGLAKVSRAPRLEADSGSVTASDQATGEGALLGTTDYMSPEQATGAEVDFRSDQFALGTIVYELATGVRPFRRGSTFETLLAIVREEPVPLESLRPDLPAPLRWITARCLAKQPRDRFAATRDLARDLAMLRDHLSEITSPARVSGGADVPRSGGPSRGLALALTAVAVAATIVYAVFLRRPPEISRTPSTPLHLSLLPAPGTTLNFQGSISAPVALSPSGKRLTFGARDSAGRDLLWVRALNAPNLIPLPGTEGASYPFWSPDERFIGFFAEGRLRKIPAGGGLSETVCDARDGRGGAWTPRGTILFAPDSVGAILEVRDVGGEPRPVTAESLDKKSFSHRWPALLPDGEHFLYLVHYSEPGSRDGGLFVGSLRTSERRRLLPDITNAAYADPGQLLFVRDDVLMAAPFDPHTLRLTGSPVSVGERVTSHPYRWDAAFSAAAGMLAYQEKGGSAQAQLTWYDRSGRRREAIGPPGDFGGIRLSPDGSLCAAELRDPLTGTLDLWIFDLVRGVSSRLTTGSMCVSPVWSPDGSRVAFSSNRSGNWDIYQKPVGDPAARDELMYESAGDKTPTDWLRDGTIVFNNAPAGPTHRWEIWLLAIPRVASAFLQTRYDERDACLSPDGKLIAYVSSESGAKEVYVQTYPRADWRRRVSTTGGVHPLWRSSGTELFFLGADQKLFATTVNAGPKADVPLATPLMEAPVPPSATDIPLYAVSQDGKRVLIGSAGATSATPLTVVLDWTATLKK
jgi:serine/threonine protein kinase